MIKAVIFDLDGTLLNTATTITYYLNRTLTSGGISTITEDECKEFLGDGARMLIKRALGKSEVTDSQTVESMLAKYNSMYDADSTYLTEPYEDIPLLIRELNSRGIKLAVLSNKPHPTTSKLVQSYFTDCFDSVCGGREGIPLKPNPDSVLCTLDALGVGADEVMFVGDTAVDVLTGKNMGAKMSVGVLWGFRSEAELLDAGADVLVSSPLQILNYLG